MAIVRNNTITKSLRGRIGNLIFRQRNGKTVVYSLPRTYPPPTPLQKSRRLLFASVVVQARQAIRNPSLRDFFKLLAHDGQSTYHAALSFYLKKAHAPKPDIKLPSKEKVKKFEVSKQIRPLFIHAPTILDKGYHTLSISHEMLLRHGFP